MPFIDHHATGARKRTRTSTPLPAPAPEAGASTNSAIRARETQYSCVSGRGGPLSDQVILSTAVPALPGLNSYCRLFKRASVIFTQVGLESLPVLVQSARRLLRCTTEHICKAS